MCIRDRSIPFRRELNVIQAALFADYLMLYEKITEQTLPLYFALGYEFFSLLEDGRDRLFEYLLEHMQ